MSNEDRSSPEELSRAMRRGGVSIPRIALAAVAGAVIGVGIRLIALWLVDGISDSAGLLVGFAMAGLIIGVVAAIQIAPAFHEESEQTRR